MLYINIYEYIPCYIFIYIDIYEYIPCFIFIYIDIYEYIPYIPPSLTVNKRS